jgi:putative NADH-flavin reductase
MRIAIIGASGKTGAHLVRAALARGHEVSALCRASSASRLDAFRNAPGFRPHTAAVIADESAVRAALDGCDGAIAILISVRRLKATALVRAMQRCAVRRVVFTAGEVTTHRNPGERYTARQWLLRTLAPPLTAPTPYSVTDMLRASRLVREHDWDWTIVRAPTLIEGEPTGHRRCDLHEITGRDRLRRADYAAALLEALGEEQSSRRAVTVTGLTRRRES